MGSPGRCVTRLISQHRDMLKHKLRKSRKNILSLLDYVQEQEEDAKIPEYSEIKKPGRKEKRKKDEVKNSFDKKYNKPRSKSEVRDKKEEKIRNVETQTGDERSGSAGLCYYMPILVPCPVTRRSSPAEDYMMTLSGVSSLIDQQQQLLRLFQTNSSRGAGDQNDTSDKQTGGDPSSSHHSRHSLDTVDKRSTENNNTKDLTRSSSSSMQTLRRILEIEEFRKFSDMLESKIDKKVTNEML